jgi:hypothetical protein
MNKYMKNPEKAFEIGSRRSAIGFLSGQRKSRKKEKTESGIYLPETS